MNAEIAKEKIAALLGSAGIGINGSNPWDIQVNDTRFYSAVLTHGSLGAGEAYVEGWWDCQRVDQLFEKVLRSSVETRLRKDWKLMLRIFIGRIFNPQSPARVKRKVQRHYDLSNDLFRYMLDNRMVYSCAYWKEAKNLDEAQEHKLDLICRKLNLQPGQHVLDIGCGWGSFARFAAERYGVRVTGITLSYDQKTYADSACRGLPVDIQLLDYRQLKGQYDHIVSIGMFEHVGYMNYRTYMRIVHDMLKPTGLFLLHTIGGNVSTSWTDPWINKYIFPGSLIPSIRQIGKAIERLFIMEDWHNLSVDYDKTLLAWYNNFTSHWDKLKHRFDDHFYRLWSYYLLSCAGSFRARKNQVWQVVLSKNGVVGGYHAVR